MLSLDQILESLAALVGMFRVSAEKPLVPSVQSMKMGDPAVATRRALVGGRRIGHSSSNLLKNFKHLNNIIKYYEDFATKLSVAYAFG